jgi:hypothetical protein
MFSRTIAAKSMNQVLKSYQEQSLFPVLTADQLLASPKIQELQRQVNQLVQLPEDYYQAVYTVLITNFAEYVQVLPSIEGGALGGLLDEGLRRALLALQLYLENSEKKETDPLETYAIFSAALTLDLRKVLANKKIIISDATGAYVDEWLPFEGALVDRAQHYKIRHFNRPLTYMSPYITLVLARQVMPLEGFSWIAEDARLLNMWLAGLCGDEESAGVLGHFLQLAKKRLPLLQNGQQGGGGILPIELKIPGETELGEAFWQWLRNKLAAGDYNTANSNVHVVAAGVLVGTPKIFQEFCKERNLSNWSLVAGQFNSLGLAQSTDDYVDVSAKQKFLYLNKDSILKEGVEKKTNASKASGKSFFDGSGQEERISMQENAQRKSDYKQQENVLVEREWFFGVSRKVAVTKFFETLAKQQKRAQRFALLKRLLRRVVLAKRMLSMRFKK